MAPIKFARREFLKRTAARAGSHRAPTERATIKIDDPKSRLNAAFQGQEFVWEDEFFRFTTPPYSRDQVHVLLSFDVEKTDLNQGPDCAIRTRPDKDYPDSRIRAYGGGRIFYMTVGHTNALFQAPAMAQHFLTGLQFVLGDVEADTTPSAKLAAGQRR